MGRVPGAVLCCAGLLVALALAPGAAVASEGCPNEQLRAENNSLGLPDCRAYEMVTPVDKDSAVVYPVPAPTIAADGASLAGRSRDVFGGSNGEVPAGQEVFYRFTRAGSGWVTSPLNPFRGALGSIGVEDSVWGPAETYPAPSAIQTRLRAADGSLSEIGPGSNVLGAAAEAVNGVLLTVNEDGLRWPFDPTLSGESLYEYKGTGNTVPSLVGVSGGAGSTVVVSQCGTELGYSDREFGSRNAVSEDGSVVFFTAVGMDHSDCGGIQPPVNELFARVGGERTVAISEPTVTDCPLCDTNASADAVFQGASADGSRAFFTTTQPLLGTDTSENLYEYDFDPPAGQPKVVRVSGGDGSVSEPTAEVRSVTDVSEDGSHVYFIAKGVLTSKANNVGGHAQPGGENLYVWERDAEYPAGRTVFIAACGDIGLVNAGENEERQVTPDGRFLVFASGCHLTPGDTSTARQVFQYDAQSGSMVRVSSGLEGFNDNGNVMGEDPSGDLDAKIAPQPRAEEALGQRGGVLARTMSDDGSFVFFQSPVGLTPHALNEAQVAEGNHGSFPVYAQNVYEYHGGRVSLVGSEATPLPSIGGPSGQTLIGTSASGGDVFFTTEAQLVSQDTDTQVNFYDARIDGGFPAPVAPPGCGGDACQGSLSAPPAFGAPSSAVFAGGGNLTPPVSTPVAAPKGLTAGQKLSRALKACLKDPKRRRASCEAKAEKRFGRSSRAVKSDRGGR